MPVSKKRKDHNKRVINRNEKIKQDKSKINRLRRDWIDNLIKKEQENGLFDNTKKIDDILDSSSDDIEIDGPII